MVDQIITQVKQVIEIIDQFQEVNQYLKDGWVLLNVHARGIASDNPPGQVSVYILGWTGPEE